MRTVLAGSSDVLPVAVRAAQLAGAAPYMQGGFWFARVDGQTVLIDCELEAWIPVQLTPWFACSALSH